MTRMIDEWVTTHLSFGPVDAVLRRRGIADDTFGSMVGVDRQTVGRWRTVGRFGVDRADRCAVALGYHPIELWGDLYERSEDMIVAVSDVHARSVRERRLATYRRLNRRRRHPPAVWDWPDNYAVRAHTCAMDGCRCGRRIA